MMETWFCMGRRALLTAATGLLLFASACVDGTPTDVTSIASKAPVRFALGIASNLSADEEEALGDAFDRIDEIRIQLFRNGEQEPFLDTLVAVVPGQDSYVIELTIETLDPGVAEILQVALTGSAGGVELFSARGEISVRAGQTSGGFGGEAGSGSGGDGEVVAIDVQYTGPGLRGRIVNEGGGSAVGVTVDLIQNGQTVASAATTQDGEYLFTDLLPGSYTVRVTPPSGLTSCPAERSIGPITSESSLVGSFRLSTGACELRVLLLSGGDVDDNSSVGGGISGLLPQATIGSAFVVVDPPSLETMLAYDVVLLYENGSYDDADRVGNRVAEYVAAGGNVVFGGFYWQNRSDGPLGHPGWGDLESLDPFSASGGTRYAPGSLGSTAPHPITQGVTALTVSNWWGGVSAKGGTSVVATWADGSPMAGHRTLSGGQRMVAISAFPGLMGQCCSTGDFNRLWANAVEWAAAAGGPVQPSPRSGR